MTKFSDRFEYKPNEFREKSSNPRLTTPTPTSTLIPLVESPTSSSNKIPAITLVNSVNKKLQNQHIPTELRSLASNKLQHFRSLLTSNFNKSSSSNKKEASKTRNKQYRSESFQHYDTKSNSSNRTFTKIFSRHQDVFDTQSPSNYSFSDLSTSNTDNSSSSSFNNEDFLIRNLPINKNLFSGLSLTNQIKNQKLKRGQLMKENYFEPIADNFNDNDESSLIAFEKNSHSKNEIVLSKETRRCSRKSQMMPQPLTKLPVYDFGRPFSNDYHTKQKNDVSLKMMPLKRSLTHEGSKNQNFYQRQQYFKSFHTQLNPASRLNNHNLMSYLNSNAYTHVNATSVMSSEIHQNMQHADKNNNLPKSLNLLDLQSYCNRKDARDDYSTCKCNVNQSIRTQIESNPSSFINMSDKSFVDHNTVPLNNSKFQSKTFNFAKKNYEDQYVSSLFNKKQGKNKIDHRNYDLNLNNILKTNLFNDLNRETSDDDDEEIDLGNNEIEQELLNSFHRPHSSIQIENQEDDGMDFSFFKPSINSNDPYLTTSHYTNVFKKRFNNMNYAYKNNVSIFS